MAHRWLALQNALSLQLPAAVLWASGIFACALLLLCLRRIDWQRLKQHPFTLHVFFIWVIVLSLFSMGRTGVLPGLSLHLFAITAATLMMGWKIAYPAVCFSQLCLWLTGFEPAALLGWNCLIFAALPVFLSEGFCRLLRRVLPANPFIFTLGAGFFGAILSMFAMMAANSALLFGFGVYPLTSIVQKYLQFSPVIIYPEGFINGVIITALVAFHPKVISAFDPDRYFINRP